MGGDSGVDFTISVFLFCTFGDLPLILVGLSANPKKRTRFCIQRYLSYGGGQSSGNVELWCNVVFIMITIFNI